MHILKTAYCLRLGLATLSREREREADAAVCIEHVNGCIFCWHRTFKWVHIYISLNKDAEMGEERKGGEGREGTLSGRFEAQLVLILSRCWEYLEWMCF